MDIVVPYKGLNILEYMHEENLFFTISPYTVDVGIFDMAFPLGIPVFTLRDILGKYSVNVLNDTPSKNVFLFDSVSICKECIDELSKYMKMNDPYYSKAQVGPISISLTSRGYLLLLEGGKIIQDKDLGFEYRDVIEDLGLSFSTRNPFDGSSWFVFRYEDDAISFCKRILKHLGLDTIKVVYGFGRYSVYTKYGTEIINKKPSISLQEISSFVSDIRELHSI